MGISVVVARGLISNKNEPVIVHPCYDYCPMGSRSTRAVADWLTLGGAGELDVHGDGVDHEGVVAVGLSKLVDRYHPPNCPGE